MILSLREIILTIVGKKPQLWDILDFSLNSYIISQRSVFVIFFYWVNWKETSSFRVQVRESLFPSLISSITNKKFHFNLNFKKEENGGNTYLMYSIEDDEKDELEDQMALSHPEMMNLAYHIFYFWHPSG